MSTTDNIIEIVKTFPLYEKIKEDFKESEILSSHTSFKIGGAAQLFFTPSSFEELQEVCSFFIQNKIELSIFGNGSNLLVSDKGIKGVVISLEKLKDISIVEEKDECIVVKVDAGSKIDELLTFCVEHELSGMEDFAGLPASIGGATFMNAKCFDTSISDVLLCAQCLSLSKPSCSFVKYKIKDGDWAYKKSPFQQHTDGIKAHDGRLLILSVFFVLKKGFKEKIKEKMKMRVDTRNEKKHFAYPSAGSVFKNDYNVGIPTGKLVSEAGLLGFCKGGAKVAPWHGNFIINTGGATASDVIYIMEEIREKIKIEYGIILEPEIIYCE